MSLVVLLRLLRKALSQQNIYYSLTDGRGNEIMRQPRHTSDNCGIEEWAIEGKPRIFVKTQERADTARSNSRLFYKSRNVADKTPVFQGFFVTLHGLNRFFLVEESKEGTF